MTSQTPRLSLIPLPLTITLKHQVYVNGSVHIISKSTQKIEYQTTKRPNKSYFTPNGLELTI